MRTQLEEVKERIFSQRKGVFLFFLPPSELSAFRVFWQKAFFPSAKERWWDWVEPEELKIEAVREGLRQMEEKALYGWKVFFLGNLAEATPEIQNTLLKSLEEVRENQVFLLYAFSEEGILPTILSRCQKVYLRKKEGVETKKLWQGSFNLKEWWAKRPRSREELREKMRELLLSVSRVRGNAELKRVLLEQFLLAKSTNINLDLFWLNLYFRLRSCLRKSSTSSS
ncbi:hypothetical protein J7L13_02565 [bacterium]|nr:hypothetical protein [bacterium]